MSVCDPGCVKTPTSNLQVESLSRLRRIRKEPLWQSPSKEEKRENNSAHSLLVHVFTQPGVKMRNTRNEQMFSALPSNSDIGHLGHFLPLAVTAATVTRQLRSLAHRVGVFGAGGVT